MSACLVIETLGGAQHSDVVDLVLRLRRCLTVDSVSPRALANTFRCSLIHLMLKIYSIRLSDVDSTTFTYISGRLSRGPREFRKPDGKSCLARLHQSLSECVGVCALVARGSWQFVCLIESYAQHWAHGLRLFAAVRTCPNMT